MSLEVLSRGLGYGADVSGLEMSVRTRRESEKVSAVSGGDSLALHLPYQNELGLVVLGLLTRNEELE